MVNKIKDKTKCLYRNEHLEHSLRDKIHAAAVKRYGNPVPQAAQERIAEEERHIFSHGYATMFWAIAQLTGFSETQGYPVSFRGNTGNLILSYLVGITANDPMELGLRWESCLGPDRDQMPEITLNVAGWIRENLREYLKNLLPECDVVCDLPCMSPWKIIIVPKESGPYVPDREYFSFDLCSHDLMDMAGQAMQRSGETPNRSDILSEDFISKLRHIDLNGIPALSDLPGMMDLIRELEPETFDDLIKIMGVCLAPEIRFQVQELSGLALFDQLVGTREDVYDICIKHDISTEDAFYIMQQTRKGKFDRLSPAYMDMIYAKNLPDSFMRTAGATQYLYPRGQCADYIYWALVLAWYRCKGVI